MLKLSIAIRSVSKTVGILNPVPDVTVHHVLAVLVCAHGAVSLDYGSILHLYHLDAAALSL